MKQLLLTLLLAVPCTVVQAQVTCQTYGNTTNCNGSLGHSGISPLQAGDMSNFGNDIAAQQQAAAQANLANQQAALVAQQREYLRQQTEALQRQREAEASQRQQQQAVAWKKQQDAEASQRIQNDDDADASSVLACVRRFTSAKTTELAAINRCNRDPYAAPYRRPSEAPQAEAEQDTASQGPRDSVRSDSAAAMPPSAAGQQFRQKWNALDDALANGVITRAEYDKKLSALLAKQGRDPNDRIVSQSAPN